MKGKPIIIGIMLVIVAVGLSGCIYSLHTDVHIDAIPYVNVAVGDNVFLFSDQTRSGEWMIMNEYPSVSHNITSWHWDFGDGVFSKEQNPIHVYNKTGVYYPSVTVTSEKGHTKKGYYCWNITVIDPQYVELNLNETYSTEGGNFTPLIYDVIEGESSFKTLHISLKYGSPSGKRYGPPQYMFLSYGNSTVYTDIGIVLWGKGYTGTEHYSFTIPEDVELDECQAYFYGQREGVFTKFVMNIE